MRSLFTLLLGLAPLCPVFAQDVPADGPTPRQVVERAVEAIGGLELLTTPAASHRWIKCEFPEEKESFVGESFGQAGKVKLIHHSTDPNEPLPRVLVLNGDKGWISFEGITVELDEEGMARLQRARHADKVAGLVTLLQDKGYTLSHLDPADVKGQPAVGVKAEFEGQPEMRLYFDKGTGLLVKTWQKFHDEDVGREVVHELYYSDYREYNPVAAEEKKLKAAGLSLQGGDLLDWLRRRTPSAEFRLQVESLIEKLNSDSFRTRAVATEKLQKMGPEAVPFLRQALDSGEQEVVRRAQECLQAIGRDPASELVPAVVRVVAATRPDGAAEVLLGYLPWADGDVRRDVEAALYEVARPQGRPADALARAADARDGILRKAARAALGLDPEYAKAPGRRLFVRGFRYAGRCEMYRDGRRHMVIDAVSSEYFNALPDSTFSRPDQQGPKATADA